MTTADPSTRRRENTRARLLAAAHEVFAEVGLDGASVEMICDRADYTRGAFYSNFSSKDELFGELVQDVCRRETALIGDRVAELAAAGALRVTPDTALSLITALLEAAPTDRIGVLLASEIRTRALRNPELRRALQERDAEMVASVAGILEQVRDVGGVTFRMDPLPAAHLVLSVWEPAIERAIIHDDPEGAHRSIASLAVLLISDQEPPSN